MQKSNHHKGKCVIKNAPNQLLPKSGSNSVYYILKAIQLLLLYHKNNSLSDLLTHPELLSHSESNIEQVGKILSTRDLRRTAWHFLDYGAATAFILQHRLELSESTTYRYLKDLRAFNFIKPAIRSRGAKGKRGPKLKIWMVLDATIDHINKAQELHRRLMSPKYVAGEKLGQIILEEYIEPRKLEVITGKEVWRLAREHRIRGELSDIVDFAMNYLSDQGITVWR